MPIPTGVANPQHFRPPTQGPIPEHTSFINMPPPTDKEPLVDVGPSNRPPPTERASYERSSPSIPLSTQQPHGPYSGISVRTARIEQTTTPIVDDPSGGILQHDDIPEVTLEFDYDPMAPIPPDPKGRGMAKLCKQKTKQSLRVLIKPLKSRDGFDRKQAGDTVVGLLKRHYKGEEFWGQVSKPTRNHIWRDFGMRCTWNKEDESEVVRTWNNICQKRFKDILTAAKNLATQEDVTKRKKAMNESIRFFGSVGIDKRLRTWPNEKHV